MNCLKCGSDTKNPKFCCISCSISYNNRNKQRNKPKDRKCIECNRIFQWNSKYKSRYCPTCFKNSKIYKEYTLEEYQNLPSLVNKPAAWKNSYIRLFCRNWNKDLLKLSCQVCNYSLHIELAHIKAVSSFEKNAKLGEIHAPENLLVLCPNHHWEFDNNILTLESIPKRN